MPRKKPRATRTAAPATPRPTPPVEQPTADGKPGLTLFEAARRLKTTYDTARSWAAHGVGAVGGRGDSVP